MRMAGAQQLGEGMSNCTCAVWADLSTFKVPIFVFFVAVSFWFERIQVM